MRNLLLAPPKAPPPRHVKQLPHLQIAAVLLRRLQLPPQRSILLAQRRLIRIGARLLRARSYRSCGSGGTASSVLLARSQVCLQPRAARLQLAQLAL